LEQQLSAKPAGAFTSARCHLAEVSGQNTDLGRGRRPLFRKGKRPTRRFTAPIRYHTNQANSHILPAFYRFTVG